MGCHGRDVFSNNFLLDCRHHHHHPEDEPGSEEDGFMGRPTLLRYLNAPDTREPERGEPLYVLFSCYREDETELRHCVNTVVGLPETAPNTRLIVYVDGLQGMSLEEIAGAMQGGVSGGLEVLATLQNLSKVLPLRDPDMRHGCLRFTGAIDKNRVPFEVYVKGAEVPRSKRAGIAECLSSLEADERAARALPTAILILDADTLVEPRAVGQMFDCLTRQRLGAVTPNILPERLNSTVLLYQLSRFWMNSSHWAAQSSVRLQHPANGSCAMYSMNALLALKSEYCCLARPGSIWDLSRQEMGDDFYMSTLCLAHGFGIRHLPHCNARQFMPGTWLEYLAQQSRWKRGHLGNRSDILFCRWQIWCGVPQLFILLLELMLIPARGEYLGVCTATLFFVKCLGRPFWQTLEVAMGSVTTAEAKCSLNGSSRQLTNCASDVNAERIEIELYLVVWGCFAVYAFVTAGASIMSKPNLHGVAILLSVTAGLVQCVAAFLFWHMHRSVLFWSAFIVPAALTFLIKLPHGVRRPWAAAVVIFGGIFIWIENVLAPITSIVSADCGSSLGWGTRQQVGEAAIDETGAATLRKHSRWMLTAVWFGINFGLGALILILNLAAEALSSVVWLTLVVGTMYLTIGIGYSLWLRLRGPGYPTSQLGPKNGNGLH